MDLQRRHCHCKLWHMVINKDIFPLQNIFLPQTSSNTQCFLHTYLSYRVQIDVREEDMFPHVCRVPDQIDSIRKNIVSKLTESQQNFWKNTEEFQKFDRVDEK